MQCAIASTKADRALPRSLARCQYPTASGETGLGVVLCQQLGLGLSGLRKLLGHHLRRAQVVLLPGAPEQ